MWQCSKCGQKSEKKLSSSGGCEHQWWDEQDIEKAREKQAKEEKINRAVFAFNDELLNTEDGQKKLEGENGWSWLKGNKGGDKIIIENVDIDKDIAKCWLNSFFGKEWLAGEYGRQYLNYLSEKEKWEKDKSFNEKNTELKESESTEKEKESIEDAKQKEIDKIYRLYEGKCKKENIKKLVDAGKLDFTIATDLIDGKCKWQGDSVVYYKQETKTVYYDENRQRTQKKEKRSYYTFFLFLAIFLAIGYYKNKGNSEEDTSEEISSSSEKGCSPYTPSFDCCKAATPTEKAICSNADLAELDNKLAGTYSKARSGKKDMQQEQKEWLKGRNSCLSDIQCLKKSYNSRIQKLEVYLKKEKRQ